VRAKDYGNIDKDHQELCLGIMFSEVNPTKKYEYSLRFNNSGQAENEIPATNS